MAQGVLPPVALIDYKLLHCADAGVKAVPAPILHVSGHQGNAGEPGVGGDKQGHFQVRVRPILEPTEALQDEVISINDGGIALLPSNAPGGQERVRRTTANKIGEDLSM